MTNIEADAKIAIAREIDVMSSYMEQLGEEGKKAFLSPEDIQKYAMVAFYVAIWLLFSGGLILFNK